MDKPTLLHFPLPDLDLILAEGGTFDMGGAAGDLWEACRPVHTVKVSSFYICKFQVTQRLYGQVTKTNPSKFKGEKRPVEMVSWDDVQKFIAQLNAMDAVQEYLRKHDLSEAEFRLPTEAERELAARGGNKSEGYKYAGSNKLKEVAWYGANSYFETKAVGLKYPNELGIHDMSGNVWEWCQDWFDTNYYKKCAEQGLPKNPKGPAEKSVYRVHRGGSSFNGAWNCRSTFRLSWPPGDRGFNFGFRLVVPSQSVG